MSLFSGIVALPDALFDEEIRVEQSVTGTYGTVAGMGALRCTFEPISGGNVMASFALHPGATHTAHLQTFQPNIARGMRAVKGTTIYLILDVEHHDGLFTDLVLQSTSPKG